MLTVGLQSLLIQSAMILLISSTNMSAPLLPTIWNFYMNESSLWKLVTTLKWEILTVSRNSWYVHKNRSYAELEHLLYIKQEGKFFLESRIETINVNSKASNFVSLTWIHLGYKSFDIRPCIGNVVGPIEDRCQHISCHIWHLFGFEVLWALSGNFRMECD